MERYLLFVSINKKLLFSEFFQLRFLRTHNNDNNNNNNNNIMVNTYTPSTYTLVGVYMVYGVYYNIQIMHDCLVTYHIGTQCEGIKSYNNTVAILALSHTSLSDVSCIHYIIYNSTKSYNYMYTV